MAGTEPIEERFKKAVWIIRNGPPIPTDNNTKLNFYSYFKQVSFVRLFLPLHSCPVEAGGMKLA
jgi:hypothetical protein